MLIISSSVNSFAALPEYLYDIDSGQFVRSYNMAPVWSKTGTDMLGPKFTIPSAPIQILKDVPPGAKALEVLGTTAGTALVARKAVAVLGKLNPLLTAVTLVMTAAELLEWANKSPANKAYFDGIAVGGPSDIKATSLVDDNVSIPKYLGTSNIKSIRTSSGYLNGNQVAGGQCTATSGTVCITYQIVSIASPFYYTNTFELSVGPPLPKPPNAADSDVNWWYDAVSANNAAPVGSKAFPNMDAGFDQAISDALAKNPNASGLTYPTAAELGYASASLDAVEAAKTAGAGATAAAETSKATVDNQLQAAKARVIAGTGTQAEVDQLQRIADALDLQSKKDEAAKAEQDALIPPPVDINIYDISIPLPDKKDIMKLLTDFLASSPLVSMVQSFRINVDGGVNKLYVGNFWGTELYFDFSPWEPKLLACGGMLMIIMHGFCVLVVIRGW